MNYKYLSGKCYKSTKTKIKLVAQPNYLEKWKPKSWFKDNKFSIVTVENKFNLNIIEKENKILTFLTLVLHLILTPTYKHCGWLVKFRKKFTGFFFKNRDNSNTIWIFYSFYVKNNYTAYKYIYLSFI